MGVAEVLREAEGIIRRSRTPLNIAALALLVVLGVVLFVGSMGSEATSWRPAIAVLALGMTALGVVGVVVVLSFREPPRGHAAETASQLVADFVSKWEGKVKCIVPNRLLVYHHGVVDTKGDYTLEILSVNTVLPLVDGNLAFGTRRATSGVLSDYRPDSHPLSTQTVGQGTKQGGTQTMLYGCRVGYPRIVAGRSFRNLNLQSTGRTPPADDVVLKRLYEDCLKTPSHDYVGTRASHPIERLRMVVHFPPGSCPNRMEVVEISDAGEITTDPKRHRVEIMQDRHFVVVEADQPPLYSGVYAYWIWQTAAGEDLTLPVDATTPGASSERGAGSGT